MNLEIFEKLDKAKKENILLVGIKEFARLPYHEVNTDEVTKKCGISKGLLFHYFSSKKNYYLYCLQKALEVLMKRVDHQELTSLCEILFSSMDAKFALCKQCPDQMRMVNMASMLY